MKPKLSEQGIVWVSLVDMQKVSCIEFENSFLDGHDMERNNGHDMERNNLLSLHWIIRLSLQNDDILMVKCTDGIDIA